jgi:hypothetical protein
LRLGLYPLHSGGNRGQALLPARQLSGTLIASTAPQHRVVHFVLLIRRCDQGRNLFAHALHFLGHIPVTHGLVPRGMALDFWAIGGHVAQLHASGFARQARHVHTHLCEGLQRLLAKIADGPDVRTVLADHSHASQMAFTGQRDLAARKHANAVGREQEADHQGGLTWWGTAGCRLVGGSEAAYIQLRDGIQQEEHQIALGPLHCRALCLVPVTLRVPGPLRFPGLCTHPCSPRGEVTKDSQSAPSHHRLLASNSRS